MHTFTSDAYEPFPRSLRAGAFWLIAGMHVAGVVALLAMGGIRLVVHEAPAMRVQLVAAPASKPVEIPRPVPLPKIRPPEIRLDIPPPPENLYAVRTEEKPAPSILVPANAPAPRAPPLLPAVANAPAPVVEPPRADMAYLDNPAPSYPSGAKRAGEQGKVLLRVRVDANGEVEEVRVENTSGFPRLDEAALTAVRRWRFAPARMGDRAVAGWAFVPVNFSLRG